MEGVFPPPKIFTNALLSNPDITSLIRDTEAHERALFFRPRPAPSPTRTNNPPEPDPPPPKPSSRRQTVFNVAAGEAVRRVPAARRAGAHPRAAPEQGALERVNMERSWDEEGEGEEEKEEDGGEGLLGDVGMTEEDLRQEEAEVRALEKKKRLLQARLKALNSDLGGLLDI
ncbi:hypothetical protein CHGG_09621 [Chaetomium globosum CBS 148.51]|uniref:DASH complex subunit SPC34 n=1 Tax=Chaetomium globosum (strain ATCC 6205 / CBS 148.51 / DSM 1962 / NBRC 6347 / NRRL 1970) TaxID=306901 RepID=Q2GQY3_CHAGB|nr:uncharacterized protein CHGG_09621 [Chaetomium globosum CBS 148.51]EAQ83217.1 hypothetical protein CHGG_09621 [Chaetomium globosum CBS 148.51]